PPRPHQESTLGDLQMTPLDDYPTPTLFSPQNGAQSPTEGDYRPVTASLSAREAQSLGAALLDLCETLEAWVELEDDPAQAAEAYEVQFEIANLAKRLLEG